MTNVLRKQNILAFIDSYKYDSHELFEVLRRHPSVEKQIQKLLEPVHQVSDWPAEFRNWRAALLGLIATEVGGIANPLLRERAAERLFNNASEFGYTASMVTMISGEIYPIQVKLRHTEIDVPPGIESPRIDGDPDGK